MARDPRLPINAPTTPTPVPDSQAVARTPRLPLNAMEVGPTTVLGTRPTMLDPVVQELGDVLEQEARKLGSCDFEVEMRLGIVSARRLVGGEQEVGASASNRINLPIKTEAPLHKAEHNGFEFQFRPGLTRESFSRLDRKLRSMCVSGQLKCRHSQDFSSDDYYEVPGFDQELVRVTYDLTDETDDDPARSFVKHRHWILDFWSGQKLPQHGPVFDYRLAVNREEVLEDFKVVPGHKFKFRRKKRRSTYHFGAWKIDLTAVSTTTDPHGSEQTSRAKHSYEVEVELVTSMLVDNIRYRAESKPHKLWELLSDFLNFARELSVWAGELSPIPRAPPLPLLQDTETVIGKNGKDAFTKAYGDMPEPVIGHYLYRLAASSRALPPPCDVGLLQESGPSKPHSRFNIVTSYPNPAEARAISGKLDLENHQLQESSGKASPASSSASLEVSPSPFMASSTPRGSTPVVHGQQIQRKQVGARTPLSSQKRPREDSRHFAPSPRFRSAASPRQGPAAGAGRLAAEAEADAFFDNAFVKKPRVDAESPSPREQAPACESSPLFVMPSSPIILSPMVSKSSPAQVEPSPAQMDMSDDEEPLSEVASKLKLRKTSNLGKQAPKWAQPKALEAVCALPGPLPRA